MADVWMVTAVRRNALGDVTEVQIGLADTTANAWARKGDPRVLPVVEVVDMVFRGDSVYTRRPNGAPGPKLKVVPAKTGGGIETVETVDAGFTVADLDQL